MPKAMKYSWDDLTPYRTAKPFRPFFFEMRDGQRVDVLEPLWFGGIDDRLGVYHPTRGQRMYRVSDIAAIKLMTIEELSERLPLLTRKRA